jgi:hypothetical protein
LVPPGSEYWKYTYSSLPTDLRVKLPDRCDHSRPPSRARSSAWSSA